jgi:hypothetical protein
VLSIRRLKNDTNPPPKQNTNSSDEELASKLDLKISSSLCDTCDQSVRTDNFEGQVKVNGRVTLGKRDTQCRDIIVRRDVVGDDIQYVGRNALYRGAFSNESDVENVKKCPVALVNFDSPYLKGQVEVSIADQLSAPVLIGNQAGRNGETLPVPVYGKREPGPVNAVQTRAQIKKERRGNVPLHVPEASDAVGLSPTEIAALQLEDDTLERFRAIANGKKPCRDQGKGHVAFKFYKQLLYREYTGQDAATHRQLVVPNTLVPSVLKLAHDAPMAGHLGTKKTRDRIWQTFFWPKMERDVRKYVRSCEACQKTVPKGRVRPVPMEKMPLVDEPFAKVAVDIVGPINPPSDRGHRYILVLVDLATRYPEAIPLKKIDTETVAEALWEIWTRLGIAKEILSDNGSQFRAKTMEEISRFLMMKPTFTSPFHAMSNGTCERFNGVLKQMIRKLCQEQPKEWDRYIPAALFAYREVPHDSTGFSPFELLYGRHVRGPMSILHQVWTEEDSDPELRTVTQHVADLRKRISETCALARDNLKAVAETHPAYTKRKGVKREFKVDDQVLLLLPVKHNKLELAWKGPYKVVERLGPCNYRIQCGNRYRVYHANLLRKFVQRPETISVVIHEEVTDDVKEVDARKAQIPLVPLKAEESMDDIHISEKLDDKKKSGLQKCTQKHERLFTDMPGDTTLESFEAHQTVPGPVRSKQYPLPHAVEGQVKEELQSLLNMDIIERCVSEYSAPLVIVKKTDGSIRTCQDFRKLNDVLRFDAEPMPDPESIFAAVANAKYYSKFDLSKGYWQISVKPECRHMLAFSTAQGQFCWKRMPFGLKTAGAVFTRMMRKLIQSIGRQDIHNFIDDVLIATATWEEHLEAIEAFLNRLEKAGLTVRPSKCFLGYDTVSFLGFVVGQGRLRPEVGKIAKFRDAKAPTTKTEVRSFLGMLGFYRRFIANYSQIAEPLTNLTKGAVKGKVTWTPEAEEAFNKLKTAITDDSMLKLPEADKPFVLRSDASDKAAGVVLLQEDPDQGLMPVSYASKKFNSAEKNYSTIEKECLAIVWGIRRFEPYLFGQEFTIQTDHHPLQYIQRAKPANGRLMRWAMLLQQYSFKVVTLKGKENVDADFWSRCGQEL